MLEDIRVTVALLYALLMTIDAFMELMGRYSRINSKLKAFPYFENSRTVQACLWVMLHAGLAYFSINNLFLVFGPVYFAMGSAGILAVKRLQQVLRPKATAQDEI